MNQKSTSENLVLFGSLIILSLLLAGCGTAQDNGALQASGLVEARQVSAAPELSGRVTEVLVDEGDPVNAGDPLLVLDDSLLQAERKTAEAALVSAQASVRTAQAALDSAQLQQQQTLDSALQADQIRRVEAWRQSQPTDFDLPVWYFARSEQYQALQAERDAALQALNRTEARLEEIGSQVGSAQFLEVEARLLQARQAYQVAQQVQDRATGAPNADRLRTSADEAFNDAEEELNDAQQAYNNALTTEGAEEVLDARADVAVARERYDTALDNLRQMRTGEEAPAFETSQKAVAQAQAMLEQAQAAVAQVQANLDRIDVQLEKLIVKAPLVGVILTRSIQPGEVIQAGAPALTIADLQQLTITVYIAEDRYGEVSLGAQAEVKADSFPNEAFTAVVTRIADQAEFTPRNVQTQEERQTTVYAVELKVENPAGKLKPGMPVDVMFTP